MALITDNFTRADSATSLGSSSEGWSWAVNSGTGGIKINLGSNKSSTATLLRARAEIDLGSSDNWAQAVYAHGAANAANQFGVCVRFDSASDTCYQFSMREDGLNTRIFKVVAGTQTALTTATTTALAVGDVIRLEAIGTTINAYRNGTLIATVTDSTITTGKRAGVYAVQSSGLVDNVQFDNFQANDFLGQADTGAGVDAGESVAAALSDADTGSGADAGESVASTLTDADTAAATDAGEAIATTFSDADTGSAADAESVAPAVSDNDPGSGTDAGEAVASTVTDAETGAALDAGLIAATFSDSDTGAGNDTGTLTVNVLDNDTGAGDDGGEDAETHPGVLPLTVIYRLLDNPSAVRISRAHVTFTASYKLGGEDLVAANVGLPDIHFATAQPLGYGYEVQWVAGKLVVFQAGVEVPNATDLSFLLVEVVAYYTG